MKKMMMLTTTAYMSERFNRDNIELLESLGYEVHVVANFSKGNPTTQKVLDDFKKWLEEHHAKYHDISLRANPIRIFEFIKSYKECKQLVKEHEYCFIHCHTPMGGVLGRVLSRRFGVKVIYTAHGFHFYKGAPILNWIVYYPVEKMLSLWTDILITINKEDYYLATTRFKAKNVVNIPGVGIDVLKRNTEQCKNEICNQLEIDNSSFLVLSVGELNKNKNHAIIIEALSKLKLDDIHYMIAGVGKEDRVLEKLAKEKRVNLHLLGYRTDVCKLLSGVDIFAFPSRREGMPVALMEAMTQGLPCIVSDVRGNRDLIENEKGGLLCDLRKPEDFAEAILRFYSDKYFLQKCGMFNKNIIDNYSKETVVRIMKQAYIEVAE